MLGLYYRIWVDCIQRAKSQPANLNNWKTGSLILMTISMSMNMLLISTILERYILHTYFYKIEILGVPNYLNNVLIFILLYIAPCYLINILLVFRNNKYKLLIKKYPYYNGKLFITYFVTSLVLPVVLLWAAIILNFFKV